MHYSGILVVTRPDRMAETLQRVEVLSGVEVHHRDREGGRFVAVLETPTLEGQQEGLRRIQDVAGVIVAEMVYHTLDEEGEAETPAGGSASRRPDSHGPGAEEWR